MRALLLLAFGACIYRPYVRPVGYGMRGRQAPMLPANVVGHRAILTDCGDCDVISPMIDEYIVQVPGNEWHGATDLLVDEDGVVVYAGTRTGLATYLAYQDEGNDCED